MFSTTLTRAAPRATASVSNTACLCLATRQTHHQHHRRHSSSKASCPPDNTNKPAPAAKGRSRGARRNLIPEAKKGGPQPAEDVVASSSIKVSDGKKAASSAPVDQFAGLPSVPSIQDWGHRELSTSSFFALHRPISINSPVPPEASEEQFHDILEARHQRDPWHNGNSAERRPEDVIFTLHNTIETLESNANAAQDDGVRWEIIHESQTNSDGIKHLDGAPRLKTLEELVAQFRPFKAPPPPQPFPDELKPNADKRLASQKSGKSKQAKQKTFTTTITVTESTDAQGQKTYSASSSPIVRLPDPKLQGTEQTALREPSSRQRQPFLTRMFSRQQANTLNQQLVQASASRSLHIRREPSGARQERMRKFYLISVKRQRKLKMKKHKYKKLMKRTRNLRRRLERN